MTVLGSDMWASPALTKKWNGTSETREVHRIIQMAGRSHQPVLIVGEPGTGKELIARTIHQNGNDHQASFRARTCTSMSAGDLDHELQAPPRPEGETVSASAGTLFLDQISMLSIEMQGVLLGALQRRESPVSEGHAPPLPRIIAANNFDLERAVGRGLFRRDLYYRLNALSLRVPPLRERSGEIASLAEQLLANLGRGSGRTFELSSSALSALVSHKWPGNIRELKTCLEQACCFASGTVITEHDLALEPRGMSNRTIHGSPAWKITPLHELEKNEIARAIREAGGDKVAAARLLGIGKSTIYRRIKRYSCHRDEK